MIVAERAERGILVTTGTFTHDAAAFARGKPLELVDGMRLAALVEDLRADDAHPTQTTSPACPKCGGEMVRRLAKRSANAGQEFWGCLRYPACSGARDLGTGES